MQTLSSLGSSRSCPSQKARHGGARAASLAGLLLVPGLLACSGSGPVEPAPTTLLTLDFKHVIDGEPIAVGQPYTTRYGQEVTFDHVRYWVTNVTLGRDGERLVAPASYFLIEQTPEHDKLSLTARGLPEGTYDTLIFHIGVDPPHNKSLDLAEGDLATGIGMDWSWDTGYKFFRTEGQFIQGDLAGPFSFHIGSDVLYKELSAPLSEPVELTFDQEVKLSLRAEIDRLFAGVQLATEAGIVGGTVDSPAAQLAGNYSRMFRLASDGKATPLTATSPNVDGVVPDGTVASDSTPPVLSMPVVALTGALVCSEVADRPASEQRACVTPFDLLAASGATYDAGLFTFVTKNGEPVLASADGIVADVTYIDHSMLTHSDLFTVTVRLNEDSAFWLEYRNVKDLKVAEGDPVKAGQVLGGAGDYYNEATGLVAFGVRREQELVQRLCPTRFTTPDLGASYKSALDASNTAWPALAHDDLCTSVSLVCAGGKCGPPADFVPAAGDIDEGRRIYEASCASCHGEKGQGDIGPELCYGAGCSCKDCVDHTQLAAGIEVDMPPEGHCDERCSADVAAFILHDFATP